MNTNIERMKLIFIGFLGVFALGVVAVIVWQVVWAIPAAKCEKEQRKWWDPVERVCAQPVLISDITGRVITDEKALAEARKALGRPAPKTAPAPATEAPAAKPAPAVTP
jgi:hypothetical protein